MHKHFGMLLEIIISKHLLSNSLSIVIYAGYQKKNKLLLLLLTIWGLTGIKSIIFNAYEDIILLICGFYGILLLANEIKHFRKD